MNNIFFYTLFLVFLIPFLSYSNEKNTFAQNDGNSHIKRSDTSSNTKKKSSNKSAEDKQSYMSTGDVTSDAFNFDTYGSGYIDNRTLTLSWIYSVATFHGKKGQLSFPLTVEYTGDCSNSADGIASCWEWGGMSKFNSSTSELSLSQGGSYKLEGGSLRYYKLENVDVDLDQNTGQVTITHHDGLKEYLNNLGQMYKITNTRGDSIYFQWQSNQLKRIYDDNGSEVTISYPSSNYSAITVTHKDYKGEELETNLILDVATNRLSRILLPDAESLILFTYQQLEGSQVHLSQVDLPGGATHSFSYQKLAMPINAPAAYTYGISQHTISPGYGQSSLIRTYKPVGSNPSTANNYLGANLTYIGDKDVLYEKGHGYKYGTEVSDGRTKTNYTFTSLHLVEKVITSNQSGQLLSEVSYTYPVQSTDTIFDVPAFYNFPIQTDTTFYNIVDSLANMPLSLKELDNISRTSSTYSSHNDAGLPLEHTDVNGVTQVSTYCDTVSPEPGCPSSGTGFIQHVSKIVTYPKAITGETSPLPLVKKYDLPRQFGTLLIFGFHTIFKLFWCHVIYR
ncbi:MULTISPECIES: hypothetical protein [Cysteiniphilum]|uniref:hypothetical protein n=1 Tax=Cysteiniphilum sp. 19X3-34 TaxID=2775040 RepID=UPI00178386C0|nr:MULTISPECIES: hypothetical protein [Cysteiniphilum]